MEPDTMIPLLQLKNGSYKFKSKDYSGEEPVGMYLSKDHLKLYFKVAVIKKKKVIRYATIECLNITAADLRVVNKYGSWNSLKCHLIVECRSPLVSFVTEIKNNSNTNADAAKNENDFANMQESCMVQAAFNVEHTESVRKILAAVKVAQLNERKKYKGMKCHMNINVPPKVREGLPIWVKYIPAQWYSSTIRRVIEHVIFIYTVFTILWAFWQLYKNVHFIRHYLQPIIIWIESYFAILKAWLSAIDSFLITLTDWWWKRMKPLYVLVMPVYIALSQLFAPLRNIGELIATVLTPIFQSCRLLFQQISLLVTPVLQLLVTLKQSMVKVFSLLLNNFVMNTLYQRLSSLGIISFLRETQLGVLDPLKSHMMLVQQTLMKSANQIIKGVRFLFVSIRSIFFFAQQERNYAQEPDTDEHQSKSKVE